MPSPSRSNKRKADSTSILDLQRDGGAKAARQRKLGEEEALAAVASEMDFEEKRRKEVLQTVRVGVAVYVLVCAYLLRLCLVVCVFATSRRKCM